MEHWYTGKLTAVSQNSNQLIPVMGRILTSDKIEPE
jgi:hypothetical protein